MNKKGFTLFELMIVIAIIALMAGIAVPNFLDWLPERRLDSGAQNVLQGLLKARTRAIMTNRFSVVVFNPGSDSFIAFLDDGRGVGGVAANRVQDGTEETIVSQEMPPGIDLTGTTFTGNSVTFDSRGIPVSPVGTVTLQNNSGNSETIELFLTGHGILQ